MAKRYAIRPSEFLKGSLSDFVFDLVVMTEGVSGENKKNG